MRRLLPLFLFLLTFSIASRQQIGSFIVETTKDELTDETIIIAMSPAVVYPDFSDDAALYLRCTGNRFEIFVYADKFLDINNEIRAKYKIGDVLIKYPERFFPSTDGTAAFVMSPKAFLVDLVNGDGGEMVIRLWNYRDTPYTYKFKLEGLMQVLNLMQPVCIGDELPKPRR